MESVIAEIGNLELAQMFIRANELVAADNKVEARRLLETILTHGNHVQRDIAKDLIIKLDGDINPVDVLNALTPDGNALAAAQGSIAQQTSYRETLQRQGFVVGNLHLMIDYADGRELTAMPHLYHLPSAPNFLLGNTNLHGVVIPVFDLLQFFGLDARIEKPMLLVLATERDTLGVVVDGLPQRLRFDKSNILENNLAPTTLRPLITDNVHLGDDVWYDLDIQALFNALEQAI